MPYDDYPSLPYSDEDLSGVTTALTTTASTSIHGGWPTSSFLPSSSSSSLSYSFPPGGGTGDAGLPFGWTPVDAGAIRGGDVVRLCHLTSTGFLTSAAAASGISALRPGGAEAESEGLGRVGQGELEAEAAATATREGVRGGSGPFLYISATPRRRHNLQNASSNCLWVLERTHCALGGRPLRGSCSTAAAALETQQPQGVNPAAWVSSSAKARGANGGSTATRNRYGAPSGSQSYADGAFTAAAAVPAGSSAYSSGGDSASGGGNSSVAERRRRHNNAGFASGYDWGERSGGGAGGAGVANDTHPSSFFTSGGGRSGGGGGGGGGGDVGRDTYAEAVAKRRRRQGAGDAVEYVRIKHLATMRYLCVGKKCDPAVGDGPHTGVRTAASGTARTRRRGDSRRRGAAAEAAATTATKVGMLTVEEHAAVPAATVFVIRPRTTAAASGAGTGVGTARGPVSADRWLGPEDLVHLQHKDTGLFLSALPLDQEVAGGTVGLTMVKSPLTTEVDVFFRDALLLFWSLPGVAFGGAARRTAPE